MNEELVEELYHIERKTIDNNVCRGTIEDITKRKIGANKIDIDVRLYGDETITLGFTYPTTASRDYEFVRLVESMGYSLSSIEHMIGDEIEVDLRSDTPKPVIPKTRKEKVLSYYDRLFDWIPEKSKYWAGTITFIVAYPAMMIYLLRHDDTFEGYLALMFFISWFIMVSGLFIVFFSILFG